MDVKHVAKLANLPLTPDQLSTLDKSLNQVLDLVNHIQQLDTTNVEPTSQVTGLTNILRQDVVDTTRIFTQDQALANTKHTHNGYFVVPAIFQE